MEISDSQFPSAKLQSNRHHQQKNTQLYKPDAVPVTKPKMPTHWEKTLCGVTSVGNKAAISNISFFTARRRYE